MSKWLEVGFKQWIRPIWRTGCDVVYRHLPDDPTARKFADTYLRNVKRRYSRADTLRYSLGLVTLDGPMVELGVNQGGTINFIGSLCPNRSIYGFDSFEGLPEEWVQGGGNVLPKGYFGFADPTQLPKVLPNVQLRPGLFSDTLPAFVRDELKDQQIAFLHVDCDLYSSTATAFSALKNNIGQGTVITFDELYNYPNADAHEFKAFQEFLAQTGLKARYLAYNPRYLQVAVQIEQPPSAQLPF